MRLITIGILVALCTRAFAEEEIRVVSWNVESGGAEIAAVADRVGRMRGIDLWGFSEVAGTAWMTELTAAAGVGESGTFKFIAGTTGGNDRLAIVYDEDELELLDSFEMHWNDAAWFTARMTPRSPLIAKFRHSESGAEFYFAVNHLYRGSGVDARRLAQAQALRDWAAAQTLPVIAVGDFNFDWDLDPDESEQNYDKGFGHMTSWSVFHWVVPRNLITTHDSRYNSILDFVFLANARGKVDARSEIVKFSGEFEPEAAMPDHRPVMAVVRFNPS